MAYPHHFDHRHPKGKAVTATATLSRRFQISIPKTVRDEQRWQAGQDFVFIPRGRGVLLMPVPEFEQLAGIAKGAKTHSIRDRKDSHRP
jgi:AbrB family looped-hinge helix DNA binding protein